MSKAKAFIGLVRDNPPPCVDIADPELFFPKGWGDEHQFQIRQAKAVCRKCPLIWNCLEFALETEDGHAILGGSTPSERTIMQRLAQEREARAA